MPDRKKIDDLKRFYRACNPARTLDYSDPEDRRYYIDFTEVRSGNMIRELMRTITFSDDPTCQLFSGHIGCGKSTELLRLKAELQKEDPPFSRETLEEVVKEATDDIMRKITQDEWDLLRRVVTDQKVAGEEEHDTLLRGMFVFEYHDPDHGMWYDANPLLKNRLAESGG